MIEQGKNTRAELAVIACLAQQPELYWRVTDVLSVNDFYIAQVHAAYNIFLELVEKNGVVPDYIAWMDQLKLRNVITDDSDILQSALNQWPTFADLPSAIELHANGVVTASRWRSLYRMTESVNDSFNNTVDIDSALGKMREFYSKANAGKEVSRSNSLAGVIANTGLEIQSNALSSGFDDFDNMIGGLAAGWMIVIAARPSMGKTAFAMSMARQTALAGKRVIVFPIEMSKEQITRRFITMETGISYSQQMSSESLTPTEKQRFENARSDIAETYGKNLIINDSPWVSPNTIRSEISRQKDNGRVDLVILDFIQNMSTSQKMNTLERVSYFSKNLKLIAREFDIPVVALSQLSRESERRGDHRPILSDLRDSGTIEADADVVAFLYRDDYYNPLTERPDIAELIVRKSRFSQIGTVELFFRGKRASFFNLQRQPINL